MPDPSTTRLGLYKSKSDGSELVNYTQDIGQNLDKLDAAVGFAACTSSTRPSSPYSGKPIMETDTAYRSYFSNGTSPASASWVEIPNSSGTYGGNLALSTASSITFGGDTNLRRDAAGALATDGLFRSYRSSAGSNSISLRVTGDTASRFFINADGSMNWGAGASASADTNLYRSATNTLATDDSLSVGLNLSVAGSINSAANLLMGAWTAWTPTWATSTGANTPSLGNATTDCAYTRIGRLIIFRFEIVFGSTTSFGGGTASDNWRFGIPVTAAGLSNAVGFLELNASTNARVVARARLTTTSAFEMEVCSGRPDATAITNGGLADAVSPWVWASGNAIRGIGAYEAAS